MTKYVIFGVLFLGGVLFFVGNHKKQIVVLVAEKPTSKIEFKDWQDAPSGRTYKKALPGGTLY